MTEFNDTQQIEHVKIQDISENIDDNDLFVTDENGLICIFDYEKIDFSGSKTGKCFLIYSLGENLNCYGLEESVKKTGLFLIIDMKKLELIEIPDNKSAMVNEIEDFSMLFERNCNVSYSNIDSALLKINSITFQNKKLMYSKSRTFYCNNLSFIFPVDEFSDVILSFINDIKVTNQPFVQQFMIITENNAKHFCSLWVDAKGIVNVLDFSEYLSNMNFLSIFLFNKMTNEDFELINFLKESPLLYPSKMKIVLQKHTLYLSSIAIPPRINFNYNFILKILSSFINERQMIFFSQNRSKCLSILIFLYLIIHPFKYSFFMASQISSKIKNILQSPFPFILATTQKDIISCNTTSQFVNLDEYEIRNFYGDVLPFEKQLRKKFKKKAKGDIWKCYIQTFREYFVILCNNFDLARENLILENYYNLDELTKIIQEPEILSKKEL